MKKPRLLYIMGIDWNWIYQRPQILAKKLTQDFEVTVVFPKSITKLFEKARSAGTDIKLRVLWTLPYQEKNTVLGKISQILNRKAFRDIYEFDYVYIGYPNYARYIPEDYQGKIIYDCMDNYEKLYPDRKRAYKISEQEHMLIDRCDVLLVSSGYLQKHVNEVAGCEKAVLVRNANGQIKECIPIKEAKKAQLYRIFYVGTISEWMDYELLTQSRAEMRDIEYHLVGPVVKHVECEGIYYRGVIEHECLAEVIKEADCLIMPFLINDIVLAVDPVKLYEYIAFGKCIISVYYPEVAQFKDFVYFYQSPEEYLNLLEELKEKGFPPKYSAKQQEEFLRENTWDKRYETLREIICG